VVEVDRGSEAVVGDRPLVRDVYPEFSPKLVSALEADGEHELAIAAGDLRVVAPCRCNDEFCQSFYTAPRPNGPYGAGHRNVMPDFDTGMVVLDVVHGRIMFVEILGQPPLC